MTLRVYNSLTNKVEEFEPLKDDFVTMYICGQTVYDYMHVGHARTYVSFDIIKRYLEYLGYQVKTVINITDVNDKINERAKNEERVPWEVAEEFSTINIEDFDSLGISADAYPKASEYIPEMIDLIERLEDKGIAYEAEGDVFFDVHKFDDYGKLSNQDIGSIRSEREEEIVSAEKKRNPSDFVLWRSRESSEYSPAWDSPWGEGVPGWHIECSAMSMELLGDQMDIHGGGSDLVFPHHENEIAQVEGVTEKKWVKYWIHTGLVRISGDKMSKSVGNIVSARELIEEYGSDAVRLMVASSHCRAPMNFSEERIVESSNNVQSLKNTFEDIRAEIRASSLIPDKFGSKDVKLLDRIFALKSDFFEAMNEDFNTPEALKSLYKLESSIQSYLSDEPKRTVLKRAREVMSELCSILGIVPDKGEMRSVETGFGRLVEEVLALRENLRESGNYELADEIRSALREAGVKIEDTDRGPRIKNL